MAIDVEAIENELERIRERIAGAPKFELTALYAAQQALSWALAPERMAPPFESITGEYSDSPAGSKGYSVHNHLPLS